MVITSKRRGVGLGGVGVGRRGGAQDRARTEREA